MNQTDIAAILPHRDPMLLVDQVLKIVDNRQLVARKTVALTEPGYYASLPQNAAAAGCAYPAALLLESWCQAAGILATSHQPSPDVLHGKVMLVTSVSNVQLCGQVKPGDVIEHRVRLLRAFGDALMFEGETTGAGGRRVLTVERVVMAMRSAASLSRSQADQESLHE